ncbi:MAG TPA: penicillin-binding transpeptidase domain-containing protein [Acidimicrobiales bacterium]|jgi:peptidoglycan glycosyltransferase|nr:penicillin-binding transpeptidase domain-containing protein [Acidimicrobiales bacterium]
MDKQIRRMGVALLCLFTLLFAKLNQVQVAQADKLANAPGNTRKATKDFSRDRGVIQTADGVVLAQSVPTDDTFKRQRQYPEKELFGHLTGYFSFTYGAEGLERAYNDDLAGRTAKLRTVRDLLSDRTRTGNLTITVSKKLQQAAKDALGNRKGAVVALNPTDGSILAMWSYPSFDPNPLAAHDTHAVQSDWAALNADPNKPLLPRAYRERYPPGSTFKVVTAAAVLEKQPDLATRPYPVLRELKLPQTNRPLSNFGGGSCGGVLPDLLKVSCNTGFAQIGLDLGGQKLSEQAHAFGFGERPPLDLPAVARSVFTDTDFKRDQPALAKSAIGQQDVAATPLQMALVAAGVANGGTVMKPHLLAELRDSEGNVVERANPEPWTRAMSSTSAAALRDMMVGVVNGGTATRAAVPGVQVAAKTGTAQTIGNNSHAWLIAFAPAEAPRVAVAVIVESQPGLGDNITGGRVAAPIAQAVIRAALTP